MIDTLSVSALNLYVKSILEEDSNLRDVAVEGEISNFVNHYKSGHYYFALKDENSLIKTVMFSFNNKKLSFLPENGMKVIVRGKVSLYEKDGTYQLYAQDMFTSGMGLQHLAFEKLKAKLEKEGLFEAKNKKPLPQYPFVIGVATSATGAALQDIISVAHRRFPCVKIVLAPCGVQGANSKGTIISAIKLLDNRPDVEIIIIARGGGSKEDMWVFNDEDIARAAYACKKPTVSAVGHEVDFTILDFICDVRAATPTAAAELALPDIQSLSYQLLTYDKTITKGMENRVDGDRKRLEFIKNSKGFNNITVLYQSNTDKLINYRQLLNSAIGIKLSLADQQIRYFVNSLETQNPLNNLKKGYALVFKNDLPLKGGAILDAGEKITVRTHSQQLYCTVDDTKMVEGC
ncbi:MAG: exodeoxyribonuclease VII large subunit [Oscillospiraceae bacterium]